MLPILLAYVQEFPLVSAGAWLTKDPEEEVALCGDVRRPGGGQLAPFSRRPQQQLAERPTLALLPQLPHPPLTKLECTAPPSPSKLPLAAGSFSPRTKLTPSGLADAALWLDGSPTGSAASAAASPAAGSPSAVPLAPAEQEDD
ncbi:hypothetical protein ABPG77_005967 [Micractinium sp. CCAP 211/92]